MQAEGVLVESVDMEEKLIGEFSDYVTLRSSGFRLCMTVAKRAVSGLTLVVLCIVKV